MEYYTKTQINCEILVAGGGMAGVCCAIAAARSGAKVCLCQDRSVLGGNASSEIRMHIMGADAGGERGGELETEAREGGIIEEIRLENSVRNLQRSASMFDLILYEKCRAEKNVMLLLNTTVSGCEVNDNKIQKAFAYRHLTEDVFEIKSNIFIDCTGDGGLGVAAGAEFIEGRETKFQFDESLAIDTADNNRMGSTLLFQARNCGTPIPFKPPSWARKFSEQDLKLRRHGELEFGYWWVEWGGLLDTIKDNEVIRDELLAIMLGVWDHIKNGGNHKAENWALEWFGFLPCKRESRRFIGQYTLTQNDLLSSKEFSDSIAYGGWPIDLHPVQGIDAINEKGCYHKDVPFLYDIPLRVCISKNVDNLMFAGRNISATHVAFGSTRVMATCAVIGQGVGTAAALAIKFNLEPKSLTENTKVCKQIQQQLLRDDAFLLGISNKDKTDKARIAKITASSEQNCGLAQNIISGQTRTVYGSGGVSHSRVNVGTHRWMSDPEFKLPQWIGLNWDAPVSFSEIELIFDTGLYRLLTLCHENGIQERMLWGVPQPETVKSYTIEFKTDTKWNKLLEVTENYQRKQVHKFQDQILTTAIRITIDETNGLDHARICECRVY